MADQAIGKWTRYWRAGALHSCGCAWHGNYEGAVAAFWTARFAALPDGARVVDVGTGNGAIPLLAAAAARRLGRRFELHGVDLADIDPARSAAAAAQAGDQAADLASIRFHPRTSATELPFTPASVDLVTGQYAFEYLAREAALHELARVLSPRGAVALVLHSRDSELLATTAEQLQHCELLFDRTRLFDAVDGLAALLARAADPAARAELARDPRAQSLREQVNSRAAEISEAIARAATPDLLQLALGRVSEALRQAAAWGEQRTRAYLEHARTELTDERQRLLDLDAAALDRSGIGQLQDALHAIGLREVEVGVLDHENGARLGWTLVARR